MEKYDNYYRLPHYDVQRVSHSLSEVVDWSHKFLGVPELWKQTRGKGVKIAVLDTGVSEHPDLDGAVIAKRDFTGSNWGVEDRQGHGTWCAGMIGARANDIGVRGLCPESELIIGKCLGDNGSGSDRNIVDAVNWAHGKGAKFFSLSLGGRGMPAWVKREFQQLEQDGCFVFCASGNDGAGVNDPANFKSTIGVGACDTEGNITRFTSRGPTLDILAPGVDMISLVPGGVAKMTGTSMACPVATAIGALAWAKHEATGKPHDLNTTSEMRAHLKRTAIDTGNYGLINPEALFDDHGQPATVPGEGDLLQADFALGPLAANFPLEHGGRTGIFIWGK